MLEVVDHTTLIELVQAHLPVDSSTVRITPIRSGKHNASYWVDTGQGRFVLRLAPPDDTGLLFYERLMMRQEPDLHALVRARTTIPIADIVAYDWSRTRIDRDYLLMSVLPGTPLTAVGLTQQQLAQTLFQLGGYVRQLHALTASDCLEISAYGYIGGHRPMEPQATWAEAFQVMWHKLLDDIVAADCYAAAEAQVLRDLFDHHRYHFEQPIAPRLLHMDLWGGNILVDSLGNVTGLVDFDRVLWGDVECEFAVLDYCGISKAAFWQGYGSARDESESTRIRRQFYLLYEVQKYMPISIWRRNDPIGALRFKEHCLVLAGALGFKG